MSEPEPTEYFQHTPSEVVKFGAKKRGRPKSLHPKVSSAPREYTEHEIKGRILYLLQLYPKISPSMLQTGLNASIKSSTWRPVLEQLVSEGLVEIHSRYSTRPNGMRREVTTVSLTEYCRDEIERIGQLEAEELYEQDADY